MDLRDLEPGDAGWIAMRHGELYWRDEGYGAGFEALVLHVLSDFVANRTERERGWIAVDAGGARRGCVLCRRPAEDTARLHLFLVEPTLRGTGLAQRLLHAVMAHARRTGAARLVLRTHESHRAAGRLYARNGFRLVDETPVTAFGHPTVEQGWERVL
jgi:GNAT superfamily N-acetyltransferase